MYILYRYCWIILLSFASSTPQAYCTQQVLGLRLDLQKTVEPHQVSTGEQADPAYFDQLLKEVQFFPSASEQVEVLFAEEVPLPESQLDDVDTDDDGGIDGLGATRLGQKRKKPYNASRVLYFPKTKYLKSNTQKFRSAFPGIHQRAMS